MGLLSLGTPLPWTEAAELSEHVRKHGVEQFLSVWRELRERCGDRLLWGDELEYMVVSFDATARTARLSLRQGEILSVCRRAHLLSWGVQTLTCLPSTPSTAAT